MDLSHVCVPKLHTALTVPTWREWGENPPLSTRVASKSWLSSTYRSVHFITLYIVCKCCIPSCLWMISLLQLNKVEEQGTVWNSFPQWDNGSCPLYLVAIAAMEPVWGGWLPTPNMETGSWNCMPHHLVCFGLDLACFPSLVLQPFLLKFCELLDTLPKNCLGVRNLPPSSTTEALTWILNRREPGDQRGGPGPSCYASPIASPATWFVLLLNQPWPTVRALFVKYLRQDFHFIVSLSSILIALISLLGTHSFTGFCETTFPLSSFFFSNCTFQPYFCHLYWLSSGQPHTSVLAFFFSWFSLSLSFSLPLFCPSFLFYLSFLSPKVCHIHPQNF